MNPILSIIIPYYNIDTVLLERCLQSTYCPAKNYEVIVIDDGSAISPEALIHSLGREEISYYRQENQGLGGTRNTGMELAKGTYILFLDADDFFFPETLPTLLKILRENPEADLVNYRFKTYYSTEMPAPMSPSTPIHSYTTNGARYMYTHNLSGCAWLYAFKKQLTEKYPLRFTVGIYHEDEEFTPRLYFFASQIIVTDLCLYGYYQRPGSIVQQKNPAHLEKRFQDMTWVIQNLGTFRQQQSARCSDLQAKAIRRKINLLIGDLILCMVRARCTHTYIKQKLQELRRTGLYPVRGETYSLKYAAFRLLINRPAGIRLLYLIEGLGPKIK